MLSTMGFQSSKKQAKSADKMIMDAEQKGIFDSEDD